MTATNGGVYLISRKTRSGQYQTYIGSTSNFTRRFTTHKASLLKGSHHNHQLQTLWNMCGNHESEFKFEPIVVIPSNIALPFYKGVQVKVAEFREAVEQLYFTYHYHHPKHLHRNTKLAYANGPKALNLLRATMKLKSNYDVLTPETFVTLTTLLLGIESGLHTGAITHMVRGDARKYWHNKNYYDAVKQRLDKTKYTLSQYSALFSDFWKGLLSTQGRNDLRKLTLLNAVGKLHDDT